MVELNIPGREKIVIENIAFDYNGTLAVDGKIDASIKEKIIKLKDVLDVYILTADTYGTVAKECKDLGVVIKSFPQENAGYEKKKIIQQLGKHKTISVGNGFNDIPMSQESSLSIGIIGQEGASGKLFYHCDIVLKDIHDVFEMINKTDRIKATLRN